MAKEERHNGKSKPPSPFGVPRGGRAEDWLEPETQAFYRHVITALAQMRIPFLIGGAVAFTHYTGIVRNTKDLDVFVRPRDVEPVLELLRKQGYTTEVRADYWLAKAYAGDDFVDIIFSSGNGVSDVDDTWFEMAQPGEVLGMPVDLCPPEAMIWQKAFIMERERFDGADVAHLIQATGPSLDWSRLLELLGDYWRVLFAHLVLFGFIYPSEHDKVPTWVMDEMEKRLHKETHSPPPKEKVCQGTLLSRVQYLLDIEKWGFKDARLEPRGNLKRRHTKQMREEIEAAEKR